MNKVETKKTKNEIYLTKLEQGEFMI